MIRPFQQFFAVAALAAALWVVPSLGTQGMGTIGQRFSHPDRDLIELASASAPASGATTADRLHEADRNVTAALPR